VFGEGSMGHATVGSAFFLRPGGYRNTVEPNPLKRGKDIGGWHGASVMVITGGGMDGVVRG
jgi:hypothetical protein